MGFPVVMFPVRAKISQCWYVGIDCLLHLIIAAVEMAAGHLCMMGTPVPCPLHVPSLAKGSPHPGARCCQNQEPHLLSPAKARVMPAGAGRGCWPWLCDPRCCEGHRLPLKCFLRCCDAGIPLGAAAVGGGKLLSCSRKQNLPFSAANSCFS